jgi:hypothetical protein
MSQKLYSQKLITDYLAYQSSHSSEMEWAIHEVFDLYGKLDDQGALELILDLIEAANTEKDLALIGAGPFEDMLVKHGPKIIDQVIELARKDLKVRTALSNVWQNNITDQVWQKVQHLVSSKDSD